MDAIRSFWNSSEHAEVKKLREGSGELDVWALARFEASPRTRKQDAASNLSLKIFGGSENCCSC
jgi:hypothetical protein